MAPATATPFISHWYTGAAPGFTGVAVKVAELPTQIDVEAVAMETDGVTMGVMVTTKLCSSKQLADPAYTYIVCVLLITVPVATGPTPFGEL